ncbi:MAG: excinuclease ABC subunit UvrA [Phycisphaerales bacterium]|nr:excinuclease ABC subunit UvrA [Phycisphaerales bacterium]
MGRSRKTKASANRTTAKLRAPGDARSQRADATVVEGRAASSPGPHRRRGRGSHPLPSDPTRRLTIVGAAQNNLKQIDVAIPLGRFVCVTGVSGSGKSSLVNDILCETLLRDLNGAIDVKPGACRRIDGTDHLDKVIAIDQTPIGRTPRSNPATYIKLFDLIRDLYAMLPDSKVRGYTKSRFSFNVSSGERGGGRCEACEGNGSTKLDMDFLADVWVPCPVCDGKRFSRETLHILYKGKGIADVLEMDVQQALEHFSNQPKIAGMLQTFHDVGLDYVKLGQPSPTLSGGEAQRIKLARELVKIATGRTLYILDEPTTGLHFEDIRKLLEVLHRLVDAGNTVVVVEHNLDVIKTADWVIDLGPEGGEGGGRIVAEGTPEEVAGAAGSYTGEALRAVLAVKGEGQQANGEWRMANSESEESNAECRMPNAERGNNDSGRAPGRKRGRRRDAAADVRKADSASDIQHSAFGIQHSSPDIQHSPFSAAISVRGASEHNLKHVSVEVPHRAMTVCCGPSGSGKSSFAIDTLYVEGQRRYIESLSAYARQFLGQMQKPRVEHIEGLAPAICIEQKSAGKSPRSTVGTVTEIYDYLRVLWARLAEGFCPNCNIPIGTQTADQIVERIGALGEGAAVILLSPIELEGQETYAQLLERERKQGYARVRVDGQILALDGSVEIDSRRQHRVELVIDRVTVRAAQRARLADSVEHALSRGDGAMIALAESGELRFSQHRSCEQCGESFDELTPHHFSFNSRLGWCECCEGLGVQKGANVEAIISAPLRSILDGAVSGWGRLPREGMMHRLVCAVAAKIGFDPSDPWERLTDAQRRAFLHGSGDEWIELPSGDIPLQSPRNATTSKRRNGETSKRRNVEMAKWRNLENGSAEPAPGAAETGVASQVTPCPASLRVRWRGFYPAIHRATLANWIYRQRLGDMAVDVTCEACQGGRLRPDAAAARFRGRTLADACNLPMSDALAWFESLKLSTREKRIAGDLLREITSRLTFLVDVGLDYVSLHRSAPTLSGGESQRIRLASQLGTGLTGVLYVLDEPTIGLHPRDNARLIRALHKLRNLGNTLLVVEHDREVIDSADRVLDFGPGAGAEGGLIVANEEPRKLRKIAASLTGQYLAGKQAIAVPSNRRPVRIDGSDAPRLQWLTVHGARENNLKRIDAGFPLGRFTCVTGVSGSGKSSLVTDILHNALAARLHGERNTVGAHDRITGLDQVAKVVSVDQSPIGVTPTSTPATYTGVFDVIRDLFARLPDAKVRGYTPGRFSFNAAGGRCEACEGMGQKRIEMHFLPDVWVECDNCRGTRFQSETLEVKFRGKSIADVLTLTVAQAMDLFASVPKVRRTLAMLDDVGLGYLPLGQSAPTLSGGEAQRIKLAAELSRPSSGRTLYVLDEPTTGLHFDDIHKMLTVLHRLVDLGNTILCIEHNLDVIKTADWVIDLGPEAGEAGGSIVVEGAPEAVAACRASHTGRALAPVLDAGPLAPREVWDEHKQRASQADLRKPIKLEETARAPWQLNGRQWHLVDRIASSPKPVLWEPKVIEWLLETIESHDGFAPTDFNDRTRIEIRAPKREVTWFCHILTGGHELLDVNFRVPEGTFKEAQLDRRLGMKTLDDRTDLPIYGQWSRVNIRRAQAGWDHIRVLPCDMEDIDRRTWKTFLAEAARAYLRRAAMHVATIPDGGEGVSPDDPRRWHLGQMGMTRAKKAAWASDTLVWLIGQFQKLERKLNVDWSARSCVVLQEAASATLQVRIVTNSTQGLRVEIPVPKGHLTPTQIEHIGRHARILPKSDFDVWRFVVCSPQDVPVRRLAETWEKVKGASATRQSEASMQQSEPVTRLRSELLEEGAPQLRRRRRRSAEWEDEVVLED